MRVRRRSVMFSLLCCLVGVSLTATSAFAEAPPGALPTYVTSFSGPGKEAGELDSPTYDTVDGSGDVWVSDSGYTHNRVEEFSSTGALIRNIEGEFSHPLGIAANRTANTIDVANSGGNAVDELSSSEGKVIRSFGSAGKAEGIAVDASGTVWVVNYYGDYIEKYSPTGALIATYGKKGTGPVEFLKPRGIAINASNQVYVADEGNDRIQELSSSGAYVTSFGTAQDTEAYGLAIDPRTGDVFAADQADDEVFVFSSGGAYLGSFGKAGEGAGEFYEPTGIAIAPSGAVYVVDNGNNRISEWSLPARLTGQPGWYSLEEESGGESSYASVNVAGGNLLVENEDLPAEESTANVRLDRFYNSQSTFNTGALGPGWSWDSGPDVYLSDFGENVVLHGANGYVVTLQRQSNGTYTAPNEFAGTLTKNENGTYTLTGQEEVTDSFNTAGAMTGYTNEGGRALPSPTRPCPAKTFYTASLRPQAKHSKSPTPGHT